MPLHSVSRRPFSTPVSEPAPMNWRRGMFRVWLLLSVAWIMSWSIYLIVNALEGGFKDVNLLVVPVLLFGAPVALLIFGVAAGWAFRGFKVENADSDE
jgi:hypothetical protein